MRSISGIAATSSPTLAPCTQTSVPAGRAHRGLAAPFRQALRMLLAAVEATTAAALRASGVAAAVSSA